MQNIKKFEIWLANLDPEIGTEPGKTRPVVIIQTDLLNNVHPSTITCPLTTNVIPESTILRVHIPRKGTGLKMASDILVDQIRAIYNKRLIKKIGLLSPKKKIELMKNILVILDFNL